MEGSGSYNIEGAEPDKPRIAMTLSSKECSCFQV